MIHILYGADTYRSRGKLDEMVDAYQSSDLSRRADISMYVFDVEEDDAGEVKQLVETRSLFTKKKLIVVKRMFSSGNGFVEVRAVLERVKADADTLLIVWDGELGKEGEKRMSEIRALADKVQEFKPLAPAELRKWIGAEAEKRGVKLLSADLERLVSWGSDLWATVNELEKIAVSSHSEKHEAMLQSPSIFEFGDLFMTAPRRALAELPKILASGQEEFPLFSYLVNYCRTLLIIQTYAERREQIPASFNIKSFVAGKGKALVQKIPAPELRAMLQYFFAEDYKIKTGGSTPRDSLTRILLARQRVS